MRSVLLGFLVLGSSACSGQRCEQPVACVGTLTVTFVNASNSPLTPARITVGGTELTCSTDGTSCSGNTMTLTNVVEGISIGSAQAASGERFGGPMTPTWKVTGEVPGTCCSGTSTSAVTLTLNP